MSSKTHELTPEFPERNFPSVTDNDQVESSAVHTKQSTFNPLRRQTNNSVTQKSTLHTPSITEQSDFEVLMN